MGWSIALGPWKQLPLNLLVLWMAGNTISLFPIMMVGMMFVRPVQTLFSYKDGEPGTVHLNGASNLWSKRLPTPKVKQATEFHYWWLHSIRISCDSAAGLWRNAIKAFHHTIVCVTTFTMPVHLHGAKFAPFLLLTGRCYDAETSAILLLLKRAFA